METTQTPFLAFYPSLSYLQPRSGAECKTLFRHMVPNDVYAPSKSRRSGTFQDARL